MTMCDSESSARHAAHSGPTLDCRADPVLATGADNYDTVTVKSPIGGVIPLGEVDFFPPYSTVTDANSKRFVGRWTPVRARATYDGVTRSCTFSVKRGALLTKTDA